MEWLIEFVILFVINAILASFGCTITNWKWWVLMILIVLYRTCGSSK